MKKDWLVFYPHQWNTTPGLRCQRQTLETANFILLPGDFTTSCVASEKKKRKKKVAFGLSPCVCEYHRGNTACALTPPWTSSHFTSYFCTGDTLAGWVGACAHMSNNNSYKGVLVSVTGVNYVLSCTIRARQGLRVTGGWYTADLRYYKASHCSCVSFFFCSSVTTRPICSFIPFTDSVLFRGLAGECGGTCKGGRRQGYTLRHILNMLWVYHTAYTLTETARARKHTRPWHEKLDADSNTAEVWISGFSLAISHIFVESTLQYKKKRKKM